MVDDISFEVQVNGTMVHHIDQRVSMWNFICTTYKVILRIYLDFKPHGMPLLTASKPLVHVGGLKLVVAY